MVWVACLFALPAWAAEVTLQVDSMDLVVGQTIGLRVVVVDAREAEPPSFPPIDGLQISFQGTQQSTVMVNFRTTRTLTFNYALTALADGDYQLRPAPMTLDGQRTQGPVKRVRVKPRPTGQAATADSITGTLGTEEIWVGQVVVHHVVFRTVKRLLDVRWQAPLFEGFVPDPLAQAMQREYPLVEEGNTWTVLELDTPLQATAAGAREVPAGVLRSQFAITRETARRRGFGTNRFADARTEVFATQPLPIKVRPLPEAGRDESWSGLVGDFQVRAALDRSRIQLGESATLTVEIAGTGSLVGFVLPEVDQESGFRVYDDEPEVRADVRAGRYRAAGTWRRAVVPEQSGVLQLPPITLQVFDPGQGTYTTLRSEPLSLEVLPGDGDHVVFQDPVEADPESRRAVEAVGEDILPIHPQARLRTQVFDVRSPGLWAVVGLPWLAWLGLIGRDRFRSWRPRVDLVASLRARVAGARGQSLDVAELESLYREGLGLALSLPPAAVDLAAVEAGLDGPVLEVAVALYRDLDRARYGGGDPEGLRDRVLDTVRTLLKGVSR